MADMSAEVFAQRVLDVNLLDARQLESVWSEIGSRNVTLQEFTSFLLRKELLTNFQIDRLIAGKRVGYFYGEYKVLYLVGAGTFARVYRAVNTSTGKVAAVKVLRQRYSEMAEKTEQFFREAQMVTKLRHINIVPIYEVHSDKNSHYMIMDFVEGQNLRDFVKTRGKLTVPDALTLITDIAAGLDYAMGLGITHRDLKLSNVLVSSSGRAKLVDFGLAAISGAGKSSDDSQANNPNPRSIDYAGLERITGVRKDDARSDIYFTGCMFYHMLTGHPPLFETKDRIQRLSTLRFQEVKPITDWEPTLPLPIVVVINKAMELKLERRYQTPGEMLADLKRAAKKIEEGDVVPAVGADAAQVAAALPAVNDDMEGQSKTVMIIDSSPEVQNVMREKLKRYGYRVLVTHDPERALLRFENDSTLPDCVVFGTAELGRAALDAFDQFAENYKTKNTPAILLIDQKYKPVAQKAKLAPHRVVVFMPLKFKEFRASLKALLAAVPQPAAATGS